MGSEHVAREPDGRSTDAERYLTIRIEPELRSRFLKRCAERDESPGSALERMMDRYAPGRTEPGPGDTMEREACHG